MMTARLQIFELPVQYARWASSIFAAILVLLIWSSNADAASSAETDAVQAPTGIGARVAGDKKETRFVADLTASVPLRAFTLSDPYRVIIDLPEVSFRFPQGQGEEGRGLISAFRYGLFAPGKSRIVLDVTGPVSIESAFVRKPQNGQPARLIVDLKATDLKTFERRAEAASKFPSSNAEVKQARLKHSRDGKNALAADRPVIVIDPGHGGIDSGAVSRKGNLEKDIVLAVAQSLRDKLVETDLFDVVMTRDEDIFIPLDDRVRIGREASAALFISIHADSFRMRAISGATVYTLSDRASDVQAAALAERENRADIVAGLSLGDEQDAVTDILLDLVRRETKNLSVVFARNIVHELKTATRLNKNPHRYAGFRVLKAPDVPSVLVELGYLSNDDDEKRLQDDAWQEKVSEAIAHAVERHLQPQLAGAQN